MAKYTDDDIRNIKKITCKIAGDYLGIGPMAVSIGMRNKVVLQIIFNPTTSHKPTQIAA